MKLDFGNQTDLLHILHKMLMHLNFLSKLKWEGSNLNKMITGTVNPEWHSSLRHNLSDFQMLLSSVKFDEHHNINFIYFSVAFCLQQVNVQLFFQVSVNSLDKAGSTPMHWAAHGGHIECMKALLQVPNCNVNVQVRNQTLVCIVGNWNDQEDYFHYHRIKKMFRPQVSREMTIRLML